MMRMMGTAMLVAILSGCAASPCERAQAYQQVRPGEPLEVPEGLSQPPLTSRAPDLDGTAVTRRADGRCLEEPPTYVAPEGEGGGGV